MNMQIESNEVLEGRKQRAMKISKQRAIKERRRYLEGLKRILERIN